MISQDDAKNFLKLLKENVPSSMFERILSKASRRLGGDLEDLIKTRSEELVKVLLEELKLEIVLPLTMLVDIYDYMLKRFKINRIELVLGLWGNNKIVLDKDKIEVIRKSTLEMITLYNNAVDEAGLSRLRIRSREEFLW